MDERNLLSRAMPAAIPWQEYARRGLRFEYRLALQPGSASFYQSVHNTAPLSTMQHLLFTFAKWPATIDGSAGLYTARADTRLRLSVGMLSNNAPYLEVQSENLDFHEERGFEPNTLTPCGRTILEDILSRKVALLGEGLARQDRDSLQNLLDITAMKYRANAVDPQGWNYG